MADTRTLKLSILADVDNLSKNLKSADNDVQSFGDKLGKWSKIAGAAFAAAGAAALAYAGKLAVDGVKSAIADQAAQEKLALSLKNVTGATDKQIKATESYITKTTLATGVTDDELRPSLDRLARATGNVEEAQQLQQIALNASIGTGKSLEAVSNALGKAYEGNTAALGKLGVGISSAELKTMSFDQITARLADTFRGQASAQAETFAGKMQRLQVAFDEGKESVGGFILDAITPMVSALVQRVIPAISNAADSLGKNLTPVFRNIGDYLRNTFGSVLDGIRYAFNQVRDAIARNEDNLRPLWDVMKAVGAFARDTLAPIIGSTLGLAFKGLGTILGGVVDTIGTLVDKMRDAYNWAKNLIDRLKNIDFNPFNNATYSLPGVYPLSPMLPYAPTTPQAPTPSKPNWSIIPVEVNITGTVIDPEGAARALTTVINDSASRTGGYANLGSARVGLEMAF